jgi:hypothetical protein
MSDCGDDVMSHRTKMMSGANIAVSRYGPTAEISHNVTVTNSSAFGNKPVSCLLATSHTECTA